MIKSISDLKKFFGLVQSMIVAGKDITKGIGILPIDVVISEDINYLVEASIHPIESGSTITDNRVERPYTFTLHCIFSDPDLSPLALAADLISGTLSLSSALEKRDKLLEIMRGKELLKVMTPNSLHEDMAIESITSQSVSANARVFECTIVFKKVNIVISEEFDVGLGELPLSDLQKEAKKKTQKKKVEPKQPTEQVPEKDASRLYNMTYGA